MKKETKDFYKKIGINTFTLICDKESLLDLKIHIKGRGYSTLADFFRKIVYKETGVNITPYIDNSLKNEQNNG
jgi:hypothetical protein